jgi:hypothetical protein
MAESHPVECQLSRIRNQGRSDGNRPQGGSRVTAARSNGMEGAVKANGPPARGALAVWSRILIVDYPARNGRTRYGPSSTRVGCVAKVVEKCRWRNLWLVAALFGVEVRAAITPWMSMARVYRLTRRCLRAMAGLLRLKRDCVAAFQVETSNRSIILALHDGVISNLKWLRLARGFSCQRPSWQRPFHPKPVAKSARSQGRVQRRGV